MTFIIKLSNNNISRMKITMNPVMTVHQKWLKVVVGLCTIKNNCPFSSLTRTWRRAQRTCKPRSFKTAKAVNTRSTPSKTSTSATTPSGTLAGTIQPTKRKCHNPIKWWIALNPKGPYRIWYLASSMRTKMRITTLRIISMINHSYNSHRSVNTGWPRSTSKRITPSFNIRAISTTQSLRKIPIPISISMIWLMKISLSFDLN